VLTISETILIDCAPEEAWDAYQDLALRPRWDHNVQRIWWLDDTGPAVGSRLAGVSKAAGLTIEWEAEVVVNDPPRRQAVRALSGPFGFTSAVDFEPFAGATRFSWTATSESPQGFLGRMALEYAVRAYRKELRSNLERFRKLVGERLRAGPGQLSARTKARVSRS
jgi:uncharacterized membrane protein